MSTPVISALSRLDKVNIRGVSEVGREGGREAGRQ